MNFRNFKSSSGKEFILGKDESSNDELVKNFERKLNLILHTSKPGSPFCVINENPKEVSKKDIKEAGVICASKSQDWRDNKKDVKIHIFTGKDVYKDKFMKSGTWGIRKKPKELIIKKKDIEQWLLENSN
ncbi:MAG: NFACT RNA binding domain-containing protein [Candidatus Pacearchaeota archaeon]|jgi:predicted ribosome quality control (RQC) complex YloA/Tae2 family protein